MRENTGDSKEHATGFPSKNTLCIYKVWSSPNVFTKWSAAKLSSPRVCHGVSGSHSSTGSSFQKRHITCHLWQYTAVFKSLRPIVKMLLFFSFFFLQSVCYRDRLVQYKLDKHSMRTFLIVIPETINSSKKNNKQAYLQNPPGTVSWHHRDSYKRSERRL